MKRAPHVLICGGGIGGLTAALCMLRRGIDVDVFEQAENIGEIGAGIHISPNGSRVYLDLGFGPTLEKLADPVVHKRLYLWNTAQSWELPDHGTSSVARYGAPLLSLHRTDLIELLVKAVRDIKPDAVHVGSKGLAVEQDGGGVELVLRDGRRVKGDVLVGADGIHSVVRKEIFGAQKPKYTGQVRWRGIFPTERLSAKVPRTNAFWLGLSGAVTTYTLRRGTLFNFVGSATSTGVVDGTRRSVRPRRRLPRLARHRSGDYQEYRGALQTRHVSA
jgi:salicylate hydroxylase